MRDMSRKLQNGRELALGISRNGRRRCDSWVCVCGLGCGVIASDTLTLCPERLATSADCIGNTPISRPTPPHKFFSLPASPSALYLLRVTGMTPGQPWRTSAQSIQPAPSASSTIQSCTGSSESCLDAGTPVVIPCWPGTIRR